MSKLTKSETNVKYPSYTGGQINIDNENKSSVNKVGDSVVGNYNMNEYEKALFNYVQKTLSEIVPNLNTFSPEVINNMQNQVDAYTKEGQKSIDNLYSPMLTNLKNDIASRFGNFDNSMFMNNLNKIENNRADSLNNFAQSVMSKQNDIVNNELASRYNYINLLNTLQNQTQNNALNYIAASLQNSNSGMNYNNQLYNALSKNNNLNYSMPNLDVRTLMGIIGML